MYGGATLQSGGTVFAMNTDGSTVQVPGSLGIPAANPFSRLLPAGDGMLHGMARFPALPQSGDGSTGAYPVGDLAFNVQGQLCGTAERGGALHTGTVFCMTLDAP